LAPVVSALTAAGLGFLIQDAILIPLLVLFLAATIWQLHRDRRRHRVAGPVALGWVGAALTLAGLWLPVAVVGAGLLILVAGSVWNLALVYRQRKARKASEA
jgi:mercuric ion transport protein